MNNKLYFGTDINYSKYEILHSFRFSNINITHLNFPMFYLAFCLANESPQINYSLLLLKNSFSSSTLSNIILILSFLLFLSLQLTLPMPPNHPILRSLHNTYPSF